ncbi:MFS transporter [Nocardia mexicana]|uniref:Putative MFS family arabinose efflux permease n=1 Tax=Nocardia mexicana TaxID=279262 RepID=A0A370HAU0_9NOCA|nr:MFS transporter [Nocardia mexicana]RDI53350.1 putative MFS family arabinose efflux permease [Nocardia mexicana]
MTPETDRAGAVCEPRPAGNAYHGKGFRIPSPSGFAVLLAVTFLAFVNYAALLSVVPLWSATGGAASVAVGSTTGVMMAATVATQLAVPWLFRVVSLRTMIIIGAVLLGAPTPLYVLSADLAPIAVITVVRGIGFGLVVTAGATLVADLAAVGKLSSAASLYGAAAALPNLAALAGGVWIARTWGFSVVFWGAAAACLAGALLASLLPRGHRGAFRLGSMTDMRSIAVPIALFLMTAGSFGAATTFLPVALPEDGAASWALLAASVALVAARLGAGVIGDRFGAGRLLAGSVLCCAAGLALIAAALAGTHGLLIVGATLLGAGFGACQNDSFVLTIQLLGTGRSGTASTIWNIAYDGGLGLGAVALGWVIGAAGYAGAFLCAAAGIGVLAAFLARIPARLGDDGTGV